MKIPAPPVWALDIECYRNYFLVMMRHSLTGETRVVYELFNDRPVQDWNGIPNETIVTFNGNNYDMPMLSLAANSLCNESLKEASDDIILRNTKPWEMEDRWGFKRFHLDHIDLMEVAPGQASLKAYGGRLASSRLQDLPIEPDAIITDEQRQLLRDYCANDLATTCDLYEHLSPQIELRKSMSAQYGIDLRSKSDAQIAEAVIKKRVEEIIGRRVYRPDIHPDYTFRYVPPTWLKFMSPGMNQVLNLVRNATFTLDNFGNVKMPPELEGLTVRINNSLYRMGIGGLHSSEERVSYWAIENKWIKDRDVASYYPNIILNEGLAPSHLGQAFSQVYRELVDRRLKAKAEGDKVTADSLKICINGTFGKLGSSYSVLYSPDLLIQVTVTGQLALLMLIEALEANGVEVISANTDGVVFTGTDDNYLNIIRWWEDVTFFETEETEYRSIHSRDVNNYIAIKTDGSVKTKGEYASEGIAKNVTNPICVEAVIAKLVRGENLLNTIMACKDIRKFLTTRKVKGGAVWREQYLGRVVRWYYGTNGDPIYDKESKGKVAKTDGAVPMMQMQEGIPSDIDYLWYSREAASMLADMGVING